MVFCCIFPVNVVYSTVIQLCITSCQGRFDILTLSGSYVRTEIGGRTGGLSVCLASTDGQIIGGGVGGPLIAGGPIQVFYFQEYYKFLL